MIEATLMLDSYGRNRVYTDDTAMVHQIYHLIIMEKGTDPLNPDKGVDIESYRYEFKDDSVLMQLQQIIQKQVSDYTPYTVTNVICKAVKNRYNNYILHIFISISEFRNIINISTDGERSELGIIQT